MEESKASPVSDAPAESAPASNRPADTAAPPAAATAPPAVETAPGMTGPGLTLPGTALEASGLPTTVPAASTPPPANLPATLPPAELNMPTASPSVPGQTAQTPKPEAAAVDPLLGPNPDLMPAIDPKAPMPVKGKASQPPTASASAKPGPVAAAAAPSTAAAVPASPAAGTAPSELPLENAPALPADPQPARGSLTPAAPEAIPAPAPASAPTTDNGQAGSPSASTALAPGQTHAQTAAAQAPRSDSAMQLASFSPDSLSDVARNHNWKEAGRAAGRVNDEVITLHDLVLSIKAQLIHRNPGHSLSKDELNMAAKAMLAHLIERTLINQEAKRVLKNPKQLDSLYEAADKYFQEEELPSLLRRYLVDNESQLKQKLAETGLPLQFLRQSSRQEFLAQVYRDKKLSDCRKVDLPEMLQYYNDHYRDKEYDRPAQVTWRELVVEKALHPTPADARRKADDLLAKLTRGENFAALARRESEGPSGIKAQGGLMQTSPGSYAVEAVNQALESLPLNQISPVLEGPTSYHILVVEGRRAGGAATFKEVQDEMRNKVMHQKMRKANEAFIMKLKRDAMISTIFDGTESDPRAPDKE